MTTRTKTFSANVSLGGATAYQMNSTSIAFGTTGGGATAAGTSAIAIGKSSSASQAHSIAIGSSALVSGTNSIQLAQGSTTGTGTISHSQSTITGNNAVCLPRYYTSLVGTNAVALHTFNNAANTTGAVVINTPNNNNSPTLSLLFGGRATANGPLPQTKHTIFGNAEFVNAAAATGNTVFAGCFLANGFTQQGEKLTIVGRGICHTNNTQRNGAVLFGFNAFHGGTADNTLSIHLSNTPSAQVTTTVPVPALRTTLTPSVTAAIADPATTKALNVEINGVTYKIQLWS
jgi:hypothetical protein